MEAHLEENRAISVWSDMSWTLGDIRRALRRVIRLTAHPERAAGTGGVVILSYRGFGSEREVFLMGRVFRQPSSRAAPRRGMLRRDLANLSRLILRQGVDGAVIAARFGAAESECCTCTLGTLSDAIQHFPEEDIGLCPRAAGTAVR